MFLFLTLVLASFYHIWSRAEFYKLVLVLELKQHLSVTRFYLSMTVNTLTDAGDSVSLSRFDMMEIDSMMDWWSVLVLSTSVSAGGSMMDSIPRQTWRVLFEPRIKGAHSSDRHLPLSLCSTFEKLCKGDWSLRSPGSG